MNAYTPGPWPEPEEDNNDTSSPCWYDIPGICRMVYKEADAHLMKAAPDLLEAACKAMAECVDLIATDAGRALEAAIKKAKGEAA